MGAKRESAGRPDSERGADESRDAPGHGHDGTAEIYREDLSDEWQLSRCRVGTYAGSECPFVGEYPLLHRLGRGGMGSVFGSVHPRLGNRVAVKVLHQHLVGQDPNIQRRFEREARLAAQLSMASPHLVRVHDVLHDATAGCHFLVMELVEGVAAEEWAHSVAEESGRTSELDVIDLCLAATLGLIAAHRRGVVHRDVKPANILIPWRDNGLALREAKLADLGLARPEHVKEGLTAAGNMMLGTPGYTAPEQLEQGTTARKASDVFAMGATLYRLLTGDTPFRGSTSVARAFATIEGRRVPLREMRPDVSESVDALVEVCLQRDPERRFPDASALAEALQLCRRALVGTDTPLADGPTRVVQLVGRSEEGSSILSSFASRMLGQSARIVFDGGPPGAQVTLTPRDDEGDVHEYVLDENGRREVLDAPIGKFALLVRHADHEDLRATLVVRASVEINFPLQMRERSGYLVVASEPDGARVFVDGVPIGITPVRRFPVAAGAHEIELRIEGHGPVTKSVEVRGESAADLGLIRLERRATLDMSELPSDVELSIDGVDVSDGAPVDPGVRRLTARRPGYEPQAITLRVEPGSELRPVLPRWRLNARALIASHELWRSAADSDRRRAARALASSRADLELVDIEEVACGDRTEQVAFFRHLPSSLDMALVPGGSFAMGSPFEERARRSDERRHDAHVGPFLIARTPVTRAVWASVMDEPAPGPGDRLCAAEVQDWSRAVDFCQRVGLVLPSEAQWEHACRAGSPHAYSWGDDPGRFREFADIAGGWGAPPRPVGERAPNAFGLLDMHGCVWEWCRDRYGEYPVAAVTDPDGPATGSYRVLRGGSRVDDAAFARAAYRGAARPETGIAPAGLRPVSDLRMDDAFGPTESSVAGGELENA